MGYNLARKLKFRLNFERLAVAQWIVHMPPKRGIQVRFLSAGPLPCGFLPKRDTLVTNSTDKVLYLVTRM